MITVAATIQVPAEGWATDPTDPSQWFPGFVEFAGPADDDEGTFYLTIADELADAIVKAYSQNLPHVTDQRFAWSYGPGDAYWFHTAKFQVGIRAEDIEAELIDRTRQAGNGPVSS